MPTISSERGDGGRAGNPRRHATPASSGRVLARAALPIGAPWLVGDAIRARRRTNELHDAVAELAEATSAQAVTAVVDRAVSRLAAARASDAVTLDTLAALASLATDRIRLASDAAAHAEERLSALVEQTADVILIIDDDNRIRYASPAAHSVLGTSVPRGLVLTELVAPIEQRAAEFLLRHTRQGGVSAGGRVDKADWTLHTLDGRTVRVAVSCRDLRSDASVGGVVVTLRDVSAQRRLEHELTRRVFRDPLTGLANRLSFTERVDQAVATEIGIAGVILIHIDDFRAINEGLGRESGDALLISVAARLREIAVGGVVAARLGGDEFGLLVTDAETAEEVVDLAANVTDWLVLPLPGGAGAISCTASVGVATTARATTGPELLSHATLALHAAIEAGNGQCRRYEPSMINAVGYRLALRSELGQALRDGSLLVEYQPIVSLATRATVGFEALMRWQHPARGLLGPGAFIDIAEESGLITPIGERVLATALRDAREWARAVPGTPPYVSVNVSAQQFRSGDFPDLVRQQLAEAGLDSRRLVLEITESLLMRDEDKVWEDLNRLRQWGVRIAIDDFGTGYSALGYLRQTPLDIVKLDRVFIATMATSPRQRDLVRGIVRITEALNLDVVAEGIENERQLQIAAAIGCAYGQGFLFARSMPYPDVVKRLVAERV